ncbi:two-partner secretion system transporter CdrB [Alteraurantiacibacter aestuarii]|uniref:ShlB/FhaC/HecB family hemolysin secretion/activation protein n=1 Tax=Alteraurantiacibacter aestuarii TaxID=650004 RepID=UPI00301BE9F1
MKNWQQESVAADRIDSPGQQSSHSRILAFGAGLAFAAGIVSISPAQALAQANPAAPPSRDELVPPQAQPEQRRSTTLTIDGEMTRTPCALDNPDLGDIRVTLSQVSFTGAELATDVDLAPSYQAYLGRELPISVLCDIRAQATAMLTDAGYLAAVEIPEQRLTGGAAEFRVVLGRLTALRVRGDGGPSEGLLASYLQPLVGQPVFNTRDAERSLLLADDIPGLDVRLALRPAANGAPGDLIGEVAVLRRKASVDFNIQNYGSSALGRFGGLLRAEIYDLTGLGDRTTLAVYSSHDFSEQRTIQMGHDFMVGSDGLSLGGNLTLGWTHPTLGIAGFDVKSETVFGNLHASYPFLRTQQRSVYGSVGVDVVNQDVEINTLNLSRDRVRTAFARIGYVETDLDSIARRGGYTPFEPRTRLSANVELRQGLSILKANDDCRTTPLACVASGRVPSRIEQDPTPMLLRGEVQMEYRPAPLVTIALDVEGQFSRDPLPAFEEMSGGNYSIGRGYDPGSVNGDSGFGTSLELRYGSLIPASLNSFALQPYVFTDTVTVWDRDPSIRALNPDRLSSIGAGLRFTQGRGVQGDFSIAVPLRKTDAQTSRGDVRVLFSITGRLLPWRF